MDGALSLVDMDGCIHKNDEKRTRIIAIAGILEINTGFILLPQRFTNPIENLIRFL
jgi:hypothetical protein